MFTKTGSLLVAAVLGLSACATRGGSASLAATPDASAPSAGELESFPDPAFNVSLTVLRREPADTIRAPIARVWAALPEAYRTLGAQVAIADSASQSVASPLLRIHQFLGGVPLSRYLGCGRSAFGENADVQEIVMRWRSTLERGPNGTTLIRTLVRGVATPQGNGNERFRCTSTRGLENRIVAILSQRSLPEP
jgi:hypothetical protein